MNNLEELIKQYCPKNVDYVKIGSLVHYEQPTQFIVQSTNYSNDYETPVLTPGQSFILGYTNETDGIYPASKNNPVIIFDDFTAAFKWVDFPFKVKSSAMKILTADESKTTLRYIYHLMGYINYSSDEHKRLWISYYSLFDIPLPPLEVQIEIVRILDSFTALTAELTAELTARKKQYEFYRDKLLSFDNLTPEERERLGVKWMTIGSFSECVVGATPKTTNPTYWIDGSIPWMSSGEINNRIIYGTEKKITQEAYDSCSTKIVPENTVVVALAGQGKTRGKVAITRIPLCTNQSLCSIIVNETVYPNYLRHYLDSKYQRLREISSGDGTRGGLNLVMIKGFEVPVPSIEEQVKIASILDIFEKLMDSIDEGLPAEIAARQKQYEYYRDKLLSFAT